MIEKIADPAVWIPLVNLVIALVIIFLFTRFFYLPHRLHHVRPWKIIFIALLIWLIEEVLTIMDSFGVFHMNLLIGRGIELVIIILVLHAVFLQKRYIEEII